MCHDSGLYGFDLQSLYWLSEAEQSMSFADFLKLSTVTRLMGFITNGISQWERATTEQTLFLFAEVLMSKHGLI